MHYDEIRLTGSPGETAARLERAYVSWRGEMTRLRLLVWPIEDVICLGRSALESARLRHVDPRIIGHQVASGLIVYQTTA